MKFRSIGSKITRFVLAVLFTMMFLSVLVTGLIRYIQAKQMIERTSLEIEEIHLPSVVKVSWELDFVDLENYLKAINTLPFVAYSQVDIEEKIISAGAEPERIYEQLEFSVIQQGHGQLGTLMVLFSKDELIDDVNKEAWQVLLAQLVFILTSLFILLFLFKRNLTNHLKQLAVYTASLDLSNLDSQFDFNRANQKYNDELDILIHSLNGMKQNILEQVKRRKEAESSLFLVEKHYQDLFNISYDALVILNQQNLTVLKVNQRMLDMFGFSDEDILLGQRLSEIIQSDDLSEESSLWSNIKMTQSIPLSFSVMHKQNYPFWVEVILREMAFQGEPSVLVSFRDITERKRSEEQLIHYQKMNAIGQLAAGVAHDFNNMLTGIFQALDLMEMDKSPETQEQCHQAIELSAKRAADLTERLLNFGRKDIELQEQIDLNLVLTNTREFLKRSIDRRIKINMQCSAIDPWILGNESDLQNGLINLGINASQAIKGRGEISLKSYPVDINDNNKGAHLDLATGHYIAIQVDDTGPGIPQAIRDKIFEPFFTTKEQGEGTGLGLASVFAMVQRHRGAIELLDTESTGAQFVLYFPVYISN